MNSENGRKLVFKRVENPEGWKAPVGCEVGLICTNISRDVIAWFGDCLDEQTADECIDRFIRCGNDPALVCRDREGEKVDPPTPEEIIWPRFTAVGVDGGWSVLDQWENKRRSDTWEYELAANCARDWNLGRNGEVDKHKWIPYVPTPKEPTPRYIEIDIAGGKSIYDTVTKRRNREVYEDGDYFRELVKDWNSGRYGEPGKLGFFWIPHELPAPAPEQERRFCYVENPGHYKAPGKYATDGVIDNLKELIAWGLGDRRSKTFNKNPEKAAEWTWHDKQGNEVVWESVKEPSGEPPDMVNQPPHYTQEGIECIDAIRAALGDDGFKAFCQGNMIKYLWRAGLKGDTGQDKAKATWYAQMAAHVADPEKFKDPRKLDTSKNNGHDKQEANG